MLRHNIEQLPATREFDVRHLGEPFRRADPVAERIVGLLVEMFFVKVITIPLYLPRTGDRAYIYEVSGTPANLEMACHVRAFLLATTERLWRDNREDHRIRNGRDRVPYQTGVIRGFREKLLFARLHLEKSVGLVWVGDAKLDAFYRRRHPHVVSRRRSVPSGAAAHRAGAEAGREVVLHKPVTASGGGRGRLLDG
jgi:hypothetical protein